MSTRDAILDAFETLIIEQGERSATVANVAEHAGISKGGLLYHFGSKPEMLQGLIERLSEFVDSEIERLRSEKDPVSAYLIDSLSIEAPIDRTFVALLNLAQLESNQEARAALHSYDVQMVDAFHSLIGDRVLAQLVVRVSDGYYSRAAIGISEEEEYEVTEVLKLINSLRTM